MSEEPETKKLKETQQERAEAESEQAESAMTDEEAAQHQRRADKAAYLHQKLEERAESERASRDQDHRRDGDGSAPRGT